IKISELSDSLWQTTSVPPPQVGHAATRQTSAHPHQQQQYRGGVGAGGVAAYYIHGQNAKKLLQQQQQQLLHQYHYQHHAVALATGNSSSSQRETTSKRPDTMVSISTMYTQAEEDTTEKSSTCGTILILLSVALCILTLPFSLFVCVLTKDSVTVSVDAVVYYRVSNATVSIANVENAHHSTRLLAQTTLRNTMGTRHLHEILSERVSISGSMQLQLDEATDAWGIKVERVEIKDVRLPVQLQRAMAAEAEAAREARAKVIAAEGEQKASKALREASEVIGDSPAALQLRYLQTLSTISAEKNSTIVFPLPIDLITYFLKTTDEKTQKNAAKACAAIAQTTVEAIAQQQQSTAM
ncbi:band 7 protein AGAP004871-like, partial [Lucilia cuprina]|uniref:band 7 protein AGAP004871-like n=1 Tax=Lucilia cuprina TaxID=7375 RepID=UPI001F06A0D6